MKVINYGPGDGAGTVPRPVDGPDGPDQLVGPAGPGQIGAGAGFQRLKHEVGLIIRNQEDGRYAGPVRPGAPDELRAGHITQEEADDEQTGAVLDEYERASLPLAAAQSTHRPGVPPTMAAMN